MAFTLARGVTDSPRHGVARIRVYDRPLRVVVVNRFERVWVFETDLVRRGAKQLDHRGRGGHSYKSQPSLGSPSKIKSWRILCNSGIQNPRLLAFAPGFPIGNSIPTRFLGPGEPAFEIARPIGKGLHARGSLDRGVAGALESRSKDKVFFPSYLISSYPYDEPRNRMDRGTSDKDVSDATFSARTTFSIVIFLARDKREILYQSKADTAPMLPRSAYRGAERAGARASHVGV
uniref:Uncharacterized protein n=1 Tax=Salix viminalis TaxID=40686 RepID=A0A6N2NGK1_SALVM